VLHEIAPELGISLSVAHMDHGVRGEAARADAAFVEDLARVCKLPLDLGRWQPRRTTSFEEDARKARYAWLREIAQARGAGAVAVGHTLDDQAETILHRIVRGTGLRGLAGMPAMRLLRPAPQIMLVRPLRSVTRRDLREFLQAIGQDFREDPSNADQSRTRARIRHDLLPRLARDYNPRVAEALVRLGMLAEASERVLEARLRDLEAAVITSFSHEHVELRRDGLLALPVFLRSELLRRIWRRAGWPEQGMTASRWRRLAVLARRELIKGWAVGGGVETRTLGASDASDARFILRRCKDGNTPWPLLGHTQAISLDVPGIAVWQGVTIETLLDPDSLCDERIDLERVVPPLCVRGPAVGDRFDPLGMGGRRQPLNDFLRSRKVPRTERARTPLLCDTAGIIWVVGHRIADRVKAGEQTVSRLGLRHTKTSSPEY
jgi:tRNA(Ile)-lysidine synthase